MSPTNIRPAEPRDIGEILELCRQHAIHERAELSNDFLTETSLSELLFQQRSVQCLVATIEGAIVGYATYVVQFSTWQARRYMYVDCLYLIESVRGRGLGRELLHHIRDESQNAGCSHLEFQTPVFNAAAIAFYRRVGAVSHPKERFSWNIDSGATLPGPAGEAKILGPPDSLSETYRPRPTRMIDVRELNGWKLKVYEISRRGTPLPSDVVDAALRCVHEKTIWPTEAEQRFGFVVLNKGEQAMWALAHVWVNDILRQFVYFAPLDNPTRFDVSPMPGFNACVWDLEVTRHERDAWVAHVMSDPSNSQFDAYLTDSLEIVTTTKETA